jgi:hypothetical protein
LKKHKRTLEDHLKTAAKGFAFGFLLSMAMDEDFLDFLETLKQKRSEEQIIKDATDL